MAMTRFPWHVPQNASRPSHVGHQETSQLARCVTTPVPQYAHVAVSEIMQPRKRRQEQHTPAGHRRSGTTSSA